MENHRKDRKGTQTNKQLAESVHIASASTSTLSVGSSYKSSSERTRHLFHHPPKDETVISYLKALKLMQWSHPRSKHRLRGQTLDIDTISLITSAAKELNLSYIVRLHAFELFDRYILSVHVITQTADAVKCTTKTLISKMETTIMLRILSCMQISSKLYGRRKTITPKEIQRALNRYAQNWSLNDITDSERTVLKTLEYNPNSVTPLEPAECFLFLLKLSQDEFDTVHTLTMRIVTYCYMQLENIYKRYYTCLIDMHVLEMDASTFRTIKFDYMLRAAAAVQCALIILKPDQHAQYLPQLGIFCEERPERILDLARCILLYLF